MALSVHFGMARSVVVGMKTLLIASMLDFEADRVLERARIAKPVLDNEVLYTTQDMPGAQAVGAVDIYVTAASDHAIAVGDDVFHDIADALLN